MGSLVSERGNNAKSMRRNIRLFGIYKIFTKRVFLPLTTIYATQQAGLDIGRIGITAAAASLCSVLFDTVTGYWADRYGRKKSAQLGGLLAALASGIYIISTNFAGIFFASIVMSLAYSFLNGAMEALIHDSLVVLHKEDDYAKIASRAQSLSLIANSALVALIPLLYPIDKRLPFVAGLFAYLSLFGIATKLTEPIISHRSDVRQKNFFEAVALLLTPRTAIFFVCIGFAFALSTGTTDLFNLGILELGMKPQHIGILFGVTSLFGALLGLQVHQLKRLSFKQYAVFDVTINLIPFIAYGVIRSLPIVIGVFIINFSLWRYEQIMYQHYVLKVYGTSRYKATLVSLMSNFRSIHEVWVALAVTSLAHKVGVLTAIGWSSLALPLFLPIFLFSISTLQKNAKKDLSSLVGI